MSDDGFKQGFKFTRAALDMMLAGKLPESVSCRIEVLAGNPISPKVKRGVVRKKWGGCVKFRIVYLSKDGAEIASLDCPQLFNGETLTIYDVVPLRMTVSQT